MEKERIEQLYLDYLPLLKNISGFYTSQYRGIVEYDDLFGHLSLSFVELCHKYDPDYHLRSGGLYKRGVDFQYFIKLYLNYAALQYVGKELRYRQMNFPVDTFNDFGGDVNPFSVVEEIGSFEQAVEVLEKYYPDAYDFFSACLDSIGEFGEINGDYVRERLGIFSSDYNIRRKFSRIVGLASEIIFTGGKVWEVYSGGR